MCFHMEVYSIRSRLEATVRTALPHRPDTSTPTPASQPARVGVSIRRWAMASSIVVVYQPKYLSSTPVFLKAGSLLGIAGLCFAGPVWCVLGHWPAIAHCFLGKVSTSRSPMSNPSRSLPAAASQHSRRGKKKKEQLKNFPPPLYYCPPSPPPSAAPLAIAPSVPHHTHTPKQCALVHPSTPPSMAQFPCLPLPYLGPRPVDLLPIA
ncbi:hypothetical protein B0J13DRAFT_545892 [Dactylonectria estremocensis]|uniref:Uncharacterized protein n=1 Tax=Dactylonectria estremocensis TaxID=1079267 RepID=A0A9P9F7W4_9HYPO|nr:hypothetical protein B0J13DRAFT_545892 [Dactylonectria estremocensis]